MYRNAYTGARQRFEQHVQRVAALEARVTDAFWAALPHPTAAELRWLREAAQLRGDDLEALDRATTAVDAYATALESAIELAPRLEAQLRALPSRHPAIEPRAADLLVLRPERRRFAAAVRALGTKLRRLLSAFDPDVSVDAVNENAVCAKVWAFDAPQSVLAEFIAFSEERGTIQLTAATAIARAAPRLRLRPETWGHAITKALRLDVDVDVGDVGFDALFLIDAKQADARRLLTPPVRDALLRVGQDDMPKLVMADGIATLRWTFDPTARALEGALRALSSLRHTDVSLELLRDEDALA